MTRSDPMPESAETRPDRIDDGPSGWVVRSGQAGLGIALILLWHFASGRWIDPFFISAPSEVAARLTRWIGDGTLLLHASYTLRAMAIGFAFGAAAGFATGFALGRSDLAARILDPFITAIYCLPKIALAPLFLLWFGIGIESKIAVSASIVFFVVFLNTYAGTRDVNPLHLHTTRIMGASQAEILRHVVVPSAAAWVITGLKVSVPYALVGTVIGEFMSANRGIGFVIAQATGLFDTTSVFAGLVTLGIVGAAINVCLKHAEAWLLRWKG